MALRPLLLLGAILLLLPCLVSSYEGAVPEHFVLPLMLNGHAFFRMGIQNTKVPTNWTKARSIGHKAADNRHEKYIVQRLDQLNMGEKRTWRQRYFVNTQFKKGGNGNVHILFIEGENIGNQSTVTNTDLPHVKLAKDLGATVWALEHRWRGKSQPLKRTFLSNYKDFLSTAQAIEDVAAFINGMNKASRQSKNKWVVVGSGYAGTVALWVRLKYPRLTVGAVSDSSNAVPVSDFYTYQRLIEEAYSNYSYECWHGMKFSAMGLREELQYPNGVDRLNDELKFVPKINDRTVDYKNIQFLHHNLIQLFVLPVVFNKVNIGPFGSCCGMDDVCAIMANEKEKSIDRVYRLARLLYTNLYGSKDDYEGIPNSYELMVKWLNNTAHAKDDYDQPSVRSWLWQQCYEYGQFTTTDNGRGLFSNTVPMDYFIGLCTDVFEPKIVSYTIDTLNSAVMNTSIVLGLNQSFPMDPVSTNYKGSNALIFNGDHDPWSLVGIQTASDRSSSVINIPGLGHASVLLPPTSSDPKALKDARIKMTSTVTKWVKGNSNAALTEMGMDTKDVNGQQARLPDEIINEIKEDANPFKVQFKEIKNWEAHIYVSPTGHPHHDSPSHKANAKKMKSGPLKANPARLRRGINFVQKHKRKIQERTLKEKNSKSNSTHHIRKRYTVTAYIRQDVDHFDDNFKEQFDQRFFKNDVNQEDRDAVRFLMMGAEAPIDWTYVDDDYLQYYLWSKDFHAVLYALEHRFFGYSAPYENTTVEILSRFFTTEQVIADAAVFVRSCNKWENNTEKPRWIIFGGSYGGSLVAAFRSRYPDLSTGAVASSAPMQAKTDFYEYMQKVEWSIKKWGPVSCPSRIRRFFLWIRQKLKTRRGRKMIKRAFCLSNAWDENYIDEKDSELFLANMVFTLDNRIQYDDEGHYGLKSMCRFYRSFDYWWSAERTNRHRKFAGIIDALNGDFDTQKIDPKVMDIPGSTMALPKAKQFNNIIKADDRDDYYEGDYNYSDYDDSIPSRYSDSESREVAPACPRVYPCYYRGCSHVSYAEMLQDLRDVYRECFQGGECTDEARLWYWLSCTQWGFAESTNYGYNYFQSSLPVNHVLDICADVFGDDYNRTRVDLGVKATNIAYGGKDNYNGSRIVFVNGSEDPWSTLSVMKPLNQTVHSWMINGTSHCEDMFREYEHDVQELKDVRKLIKKQIVRWVRRRKPTAD